jgi:hypothetical protein
MKINEVSQPSDQTLTESFGADNQTGFLTEDLVKIARVEQQAAWGQPQSADDLLAEMESWESQ